MIALYLGLAALVGFAGGVYFSRPTRAELYDLREKIEGLYEHVESAVKSVAKAA